MKKKRKAVKAVIVPGFSFGAVEAQVRYKSRLDMGVIIADGPATVAGIYTSNQVKAPSVILNKRRTAGGSARAVVVNSGNANTCVGERGMGDTIAVTDALAGKIGAPRGQVLMCSTGVIGEPLPVERMIGKIPELADSAKPNGLPQFARAIMTTDTFPKVASRKISIGGKTVTIAGAAKGAGMIMPSMATMHAYLLTDAALGKGFAKDALSRAAADSFNALTIDGDTSTSDTVLLLASGKYGASPETSKKSAELFMSALDDLCVELAKAIATDGEGATKMFEVTVEGAKSRNEADRIARRIANSPLVKTAFHAGDPNWGRVMMAVGSAGVKLDPDKVDVDFLPARGKGVVVVRGGALAKSYCEKRAAQVLSGDGFTVLVVLGRGKFSRTIYTCDLSADYVRINADYRS